ncbi:serine/threonine-protein kinase MARK2-like [Callithrix jacchus]|uniref:non-specific serine/threonine protein kinase n=1 Tax=Callithrix jacchus TaxID=9483 RepID=A0A8I3W4T8_CALJA|nr:serine/threonine-protein kinase MARK2-like [Callithrix jacchus]
MKQGVASTSPALRPPYYQILKFIGRGAFGEVTLARHLITGTRVAVKTINKTGLLSSHRETTILKSVSHSNIIRLYQIINTREACQLVLEYAEGGSLADWLEKNIMEEEEARGMFQQMLSAVRYLHKRKIAHRDIKPDNMLLDGKGHIKISDFGSATIYHEGQRLRAGHGTLPYMAPELFGAQGYECPAMDIWSLGITLYQMVSNSLPFFAVSRFQLISLILSGQYVIRHSFSEGLKSLIKNLLISNPNERPTVDKVLRDPWVNNGQDLPPATYEEPIEDHPNCETIRLLVAMGLKPENIVKAIKDNVFNYPMATYRILDGEKKPSITTPQSLAPGDPTCLVTEISSSPAGLHRKSDPQHAPTASLTIERNCGDVENLARQALQCDRVASSTVSAIGGGGALETLAEQAPQRDLMSAASTKCSTGSENLETLAQPALPHNLTAASIQITTQSTVAQQPGHEGSVLQAGQPEAVLTQPTRGWSCCRAARRCIAIIRRCCCCLCPPKRQSKRAHPREKIGEDEGPEVQEQPEMPRSNVGACSTLY